MQPEACLSILLAKKPVALQMGGTGVEWEGADRGEGERECSLEGVQPEACLGTLLTQTLQYLQHYKWEEQNWNGWEMNRERVSGNAMQGGCSLLIVCVSPHLVYC